MKKPTQYWFINIEPKNNVIFEPIIEVKTYTVSNKNNVRNLDKSKSCQTNRSTIHPQYANRFIRQFIL